MITSGFGLSTENGTPWGYSLDMQIYRIFAIQPVTKPLTIVNNINVIRPLFSLYNRLLKEASKFYRGVHLV